MLSSRGLPTSFDLVRSAWRLLDENRPLLVFPLLSAFSLVTFIGLGIAAFAAGDLFERAAHGPSALTLGDFMMGAVLYLAAVVAVVYFNTALASATLDVFEERTIDVGSSLDMANDRFLFCLIYAWFIRPAGVILHRLNGGRTFLVVPALMAEGRSSDEAIARSSELLHETWGRACVPNFRFGRTYVIACFVAFLPLALAAQSSTGLALAVAALFSFPVLWVAATLRVATEEIFRVALYQYSVTGFARYYPEALLRYAFGAREEVWRNSSPSRKETYRPPQLPRWS